MKPTYNQPNYEGLYFVETDANLNPISKGYVERLLPNGDYIVNGCSTRNHVPIEKRVYSEDNLPQDYLDKCHFYTTEHARDYALKEFRLAAEELAFEQEGQGGEL